MEAFDSSDELAFQLLIAMPATPGRLTRLLCEGRRPRHVLAVC